MDAEFPLFNDTNIKYTGASSNNLDIEQYEKLSQVVSKLVIALSNLTDKVNSCSFCQGEDNTISLSADTITTSSSLNQNSTIVSGSPATIKTTPNSTGVNVNFDLNSVIASLGDATILKSKTTIEGLKNGFPSKIVNTDKTSMSVNLRPDNFPANLETEIRYQDSTGEKTISLKVPLSSTSSDIKLPLQGAVTGTPVINNQEDLNINLQERILNLENAITTLNSINISGFNSNLPSNSNTTQAIAYVLSELETIKAQLP
jgi:hypothetical protein